MRFGDAVQVNLLLVFAWPLLELLHTTAIPTNHYIYTSRSTGYHYNKAKIMPKGLSFSPNEYMLFVSDTWLSQLSNAV